MFNVLITIGRTILIVVIRPINKFDINISFLYNCEVKNKQEVIPMENEQNNEQQVENSTEALKNEAKESVEQVKETLKTINIKEDSDKAKGFIHEMWKNPLGLIKDSIDNWQSYMKVAIFIMMISIIAVGITEFLLTFTRSYYSFNLSRIISIVRASFRSLVTVCTYTGVVYFMKKDKKYSIMNLFTVFTIAYIPYLLYNVINTIDIFGSATMSATAMISNICSSISIVLTYFLLKYLFQVSDDFVFIKKYAVIRAIVAVISFALTLVGIR